MIGGVLPLLILGGIVYAIYRAVKGQDGASPSTAGTGARRLFQYALLFGALVVAASGLSGLVVGLLTEPAAREAGDLAVPMAMTVVGVPVLVLLARWVWRIHQRDVAERDGAAWTIYLNGTLLIALVTALGAGFGLANSLIEGSWDAEAFATMSVWTAVWVLHWRIWLRLRPGALPNLHVWLGSAIGLWVGGIAAAFALDGAIDRLLGPVAEDVVVSVGADGMQRALVGVALGGAVWSWHWLLNGRNGPRTQGWYAYVLLLGVLAASITVIAAGGYALYLVLEWLFGEPANSTAVMHFENLSSALGAMLAGVAVWAYHRHVVGPSGERSRSDVDRIYDYLIAGVSLATVGVALTILVVAGFDVFESVDASAVGDSPINALLAAITALVIGAPLWWITWRRLQEIARIDPGEAASGVRRSYLFVVLGSGAAVAFGALIALLVVMFEALFESGGTTTLLDDVRWPVALIATSGVAALYHWRVYQAERSVRTPELTMRDVLLVGDDELARALAERTHTHVRVLGRTDLPGNGDGPDLDAIATAIESAEGEHLLVVVGPEGVSVVPTTGGRPLPVA